MKKAALLCALFALCLSLAPLACAHELTFGSFTLTLPSGFVANADREGRYDSKSTSVFIRYEASSETDFGALDAYAQWYAEKIDPQAEETAKVQQTPYAVYTFTDEDDLPHMTLLIAYPGDRLIVRIEPYFLTNFSPCRSVADTLLKSIVFTPSQEIISITTDSIPEPGVFLTPEPRATHSPEPNARESVAALTYGSFSVTLPSQYSAVSDCDGMFDSDDMTIALTHQEVYKRSVADQLSFAYDYAGKYDPNAEAELMQTTPYVAMMMKSNDHVCVLITHDTDALLLFVFPKNPADLDAARLTAYHILQGVTADSAQDGYSYTQPLRYGSFTLNIPSTFVHTGDRMTYEDPFENCKIDVDSYQSYETVLYSSVRGREELIRQFMSDSDLPTQQIIGIDGCYALQQVYTGSAFSSCQLTVFRQREILDLYISAYGEDSYARCMALADGIVAHFSAPAEEGLLEDAFAFTQPVAFSSFTLYLPSHFTRFGENSYVDAPGYKINAGVFFNDSDVYAVDLYADADGAKRYLESLLQSDVLQKHLAERPDAQISFYQANGCYAMRVNNPAKDAEASDYLFLITRRESLVLLITTQGDDCEQTLEDLTNGVLAHISVSEMPGQ